MVSLHTVQQSNALVAAVPQTLVALFIGATSGIGQGALQSFVQHAAAPRVYSVARPQTVAAHEAAFAALRQSNPAGTYSVIEADASLVSEIDKVVDELKEKETRLDVLFLSVGMMAFEEGRQDTREGLEPSMTTRYYSRLRALQGLLPLLDSPAAPSPRVVWVLAAGLEAAINEDDLDLRRPESWSFWGPSVHATTMSTLALEHVAREHPRLSLVHWMPGPVASPGLVRAAQHGMVVPNQRSQAEAGARGLFVATSDRYAAQGSLVPVPAGLAAVARSAGGVFMVDADGEAVDNEAVLSDFRARGVDKNVWDFSQEVIANATAKTGSAKDEL